MSSIGIDARNVPASSRSAQEAATESLAAALAGNLTAVALRDAIAAQSRAVVPVRSDSDGEPRPDLAALYHLRALQTLLRDRAANTKTTPTHD